MEVDNFGEPKFVGRWICTNQTEIGGFSSTGDNVDGLCVGQTGDYITVLGVDKDKTGWGWYLSVLPVGGATYKIWFMNDADMPKIDEAVLKEFIERAKALFNGW